MKTLERDGKSIGSSRVTDTSVPIPKPLPVPYLDYRCLDLEREVGEGGAKRARATDAHTHNGKHTGAGLAGAPDR